MVKHGEPVQVTGQQRRPDDTQGDVAARPARSETAGRRFRRLPSGSMRLASSAPPSISSSGGRQRLPAPPRPERRRRASSTSTRVNCAERPATHPTTRQIQTPNPVDLPCRLVLIGDQVGRTAEELPVPASSEALRSSPAGTRGESGGVIVAPHTEKRMRAVGAASHRAAEHACHAGSAERTPADRRQAVDAELGFGRSRRERACARRDSRRCRAPRVPAHEERRRRSSRLVVDVLRSRRRRASTVGAPGARLATAMRWSVVGDPVCGQRPELARRYLCVDDLSSAPQDALRQVHTPAHCWTRPARESRRLQMLPAQLHAGAPMHRVRPDRSLTRIGCYLNHGLSIHAHHCAATCSGPTARA